MLLLSLEKLEKTLNERQIVVYWNVTSEKTIRIKVLLLLFDLFHMNTFYWVYLTVLTKSSIQPSINTNKYSIIWLFLFQGANSIIENSSRVNKQQNMINTHFVPEPLQTSIKLWNEGEYLPKFFYFSIAILYLLFIWNGKWKNPSKKIIIIFFD